MSDIAGVRGAWHLKIEYSFLSGICVVVGIPLPLTSQSRRSPSRSPPGSSWAGGQICTPRRCANTSPSGTAGTPLASATLCPVWKRCLEPWQRRWLEAWMERRRQLSSGELLSVPERGGQRTGGKSHKIKHCRLKLMEHRTKIDLTRVSGRSSPLRTAEWQKWTGNPPAAET